MNKPANYESEQKRLDDLRSTDVQKVTDDQRLTRSIATRKENDRKRREDANELLLQSHDTERAKSVDIVCETRTLSPTTKGNVGFTLSRQSSDSDKEVSSTKQRDLQKRCGKSKSQTLRETTLNIQVGKIIRNFIKNQSSDEGSQTNSPTKKDCRGISKSDVCAKYTSNYDDSDDSHGTHSTTSDLTTSAIDVTEFETRTNTGEYDTAIFERQERTPPSSEEDELNAEVRNIVVDNAVLDDDIKIQPIENNDNIIDNLEEEDGDDDDINVNIEEDDKSDMTETTPAQFRGNRSDDPEAWLQSVEWWLITKRPVDDRARFAYVAGLLHDDAQMWFNTLDMPIQADGGGIQTWVQFRAAFVARFQFNAANQWREVAQLWKMTQGDQTVEKFITSVKQKGRQAHATEEQIRMAVINGLRANLKTAVLHHDIENLEDVKRWSEVEEANETTDNSTTDMTAVFKKLDELNTRFDTVQLRGLEEKSPSASENTARSRRSDANERTVRFEPSSISPALRQPDTSTYESRGGYGSQRGRYSGNYNNSTWRSREASPNDGNTFNGGFRREDTFDGPRREYDARGQRGAPNQQQWTNSARGGFQQGQSPRTNNFFRGNSNFGGNSGRDLRNVQCYTCNLFGHISRYCNQTPTRGRPSVPRY